jgi:putative hydrolase of the HAD superfamily
MSEAIITPEIRAVFFDAVGTLIEPDPPAVEVYHAVAVEQGIDIDAETIARRFRVAFEMEEYRDAACGWAVSERHERERWSRIVACVFQGHPTDMLFARLWNHFMRPEAWCMIGGAEETLRGLSHLTLGVASNFDRRLHQVLDGIRQPITFLRRVISSEFGWRKPSPAFFVEVARSAGCEAKQIVFVGDRRDLDYEPASAAGMRAVLFDPFATARNVRRIGKLSELLFVDPV